MRKRVQIALAVLLAAISGVIVWQLQRPQEREPSFQGKPFSLWLEQYYSALEDPGSPLDGGGTVVGIAPDGLAGADSEAQAAAAIRAIGTNAIPMLLKMAKAHDSIFRREWILFSYHHQSWISAQWRTDYAYHGMAMWGFFILGMDAKPAVPALAGLLSDEHPDVRASVAETLGSMGNMAQDAVPALVTRLRDKSADTRLAASQALKHIDPEAATKAVVK